MTEGTLEPTELHRAVEATFARRKLAIPSTLPVGLSDTFSRDATKQIQWTAFLKKSRLNAMDLPQVVAQLRDEFQKLGVI